MRCETPRYSTRSRWRDEQLAAARKEVSRLEAQVEDLRSDRDAWREQAQRKLLTWRGLFGGGKAE